MRVMRSPVVDLRAYPARGALDMAGATARSPSPGPRWHTASTAATSPRPCLQSRQAHSRRKSYSITSHLMAWEDDWEARGEDSVIASRSSCRGAVALFSIAGLIQHARATTGTVVVPASLFAISHPALAHLPGACQHLRNARQPMPGAWGANPPTCATTTTFRPMQPSFIERPSRRLALSRSRTASRLFDAYAGPTLRK